MKNIGKEFMEKTKYKYLDDSDQEKGLPQPPLELEVDSNLNLIDLPNPKEVEIKDNDIVNVIEKRKSLRKYKDEEMTITELSYLLWATQGVKAVTSRPATLRTVPSAGSRHAFETYLLINNVASIKPGLYRYYATSHKLVEIKVSSDIKNEISDACFRQNFVANSAVTFIWAAVVNRMKWRYGERGYRYIHLDAGHVCQNLYLASETIDYGTCAIAAFDDDVINKILNLDGVSQFVTYVATVGKK